MDYIHEDIKTRLNSANTYHRSVRIKYLLVSCLKA